MRTSNKRTWSILHDEDHSQRMHLYTDYISEYVKSTQNEYISKKNIEMSIQCAVHARNFQPHLVIYASLIRPRVDHRFQQ